VARRDSSWGALRQLAPKPTPTEILKLFINGDPGFVLTGAPRENCRSWTNQSEVTVPGFHYLQEDSPDLIGEAPSRWLGHVESKPGR
jgi:hypothetical protein